MNSRAPSRPVHMLLAALLLAALLDCAFADSAPCRFEDSQCSCKFSGQEGGICMTPVPGSQGLCKTRPCQGGWSCQCAGRTHLCKLGNKQVYAGSTAGTTAALSTTFPMTGPPMTGPPMTGPQMTGPQMTGPPMTGPPMTGAPTASEIVPCQKTSRRIVRSLQIALGFISFGVSYQGFMANDCTRFAWFLNGKQFMAMDDSMVVTSSTARTAHRDAVYHDKLELKPGDVIAFRFKQASYYCFTNTVLMYVNGTYAYGFPSDRVKFEAYYNREPVQGWNSKDLVIGPDMSKPDEMYAGPTDWIPWRVKKLAPPQDAIADRASLWNPRNDNNLDDRRGNWYFRLRIPMER